MKVDASDLRAMGIVQSLKSKSVRVKDADLALNSAKCDQVQR